MEPQHVSNHNRGLLPKWLGVVATHSLVTLVEARIPSQLDMPIVVEGKLEWALGEYKVRQEDLYNLFRRFGTHVRVASVNQIFIKASTLYGERGAKLNMLHGAEVRGVILAAAAGWCPIRQSLMATISKTFGDRKAREYIADTRFWQEQTIGGERLTSAGREAALLMLAARKAIV